MIDKNFIEKNKPVKVETMQTTFTNSNSINNNKGMIELLIKLRDKHCFSNSNHTNEIFRFTSAARALGIDKILVEDFILKNIPIASDSTKSDKNELKKMIDYNYSKYSIGQYVKDYSSANSSNNKAFEYTTTLSNNDYDKYFEQYNQYRITSNSNFPIPEPLLSLNNESIATYGNILAISGVQKQGKSHLCNIILAGCLSNHIDGVPEDCKIQTSNGKAIIHIDTEQAKHHQLRNIKNAIIKRAHLNETPDNFYSYNVKGMMAKEATQMLEKLCFAANQKHNGVHVLLIDGIADFINGVNNEDESNAIVRHIEQLATKYNMLVIVVIHRNPADNKARGHLGSQLLRKCETVVVVRKDGDNFFIDPEELRTAAKGDIPKYLFAYNKDKGYPCYVGISQKQEKPNIKERNTNFVSSQMGDSKEYKRMELMEMISNYMNLSTESAKTRIAELLKDKLIVKAKYGFYKKFIASENPQQEMELEEAPF